MLQSILIYFDKIFLLSAKVFRRYWVEAMLLRQVAIGSALALTLLMGGLANTTAFAASFTLNNDGTVTDNITSLTWMRCTLGQMWTGSSCSGGANTYTWDDAANLSNTYGGGGWRLPSLSELRSIINKSFSYPALDSSTFPDLPGFTYWTASGASGYASYVWYIDFGSGLEFTTVKNRSNYVRFVRNGQPPVSLSPTSNCTYTLSVSNGSAPASGGNYSVNVTASAATCAWSASGSDSWIHLGNTGGTGSGTLSFSVDANSGASRSAALTIAGQTYTITQAAAAAATTSGCKTNSGEMSVVGTAIKKLGESLDVRYSLCNFNKATNFDLYFAVQLPDKNMMFAQSTGTLFSTPLFGNQVKPYLTNTLLPDLSGSILSMGVLPLTLPTGTYTFYAIPVLAGGNVMNGFDWVGDLAKAEVTLMK